jgi:hypothetical protein
LIDSLKNMQTGKLTGGSFDDFGRQNRINAASSAAGSPPPDYNPLLNAGQPISIQSNLDDCPRSDHPSEPFKVKAQKDADNRYTA